MRALIQRVTQARVMVGPEPVGEIGPGLLVLLGVQPHDTPRSARAMAERLLAYRVFADSAGRMNLALREHGGGILVVPQFTLAADTTRGLRPGFSTAATPAQAESLCAVLLERLRELHAPVEGGVFGAHMQVGLVNDGPVTFLLEN